MWSGESIPREEYKESGSKVTQLTSACVLSNNIYCEQPYSSSDGNRVAILRTHVGYWSGQFELHILDLPSRRMFQAASDVAGIGGSACSTWGDWFYYLTKDKEKQNLFASLF